MIPDAAVFRTQGRNAFSQKRELEIFIVHSATAPRRRAGAADWLTDRLAGATATRSLWTDPQEEK